MTRNFLAVLASLPLIACTPAGDKADTGEAIAQGAGVGDGPTGRVGRPVARGANKGPIPDDIDEGIEPLPQANGVAAEAAPPPASSTIPSRYRGRWGVNQADCAGDAAAKGLLTIEDRRLVFYESRATLDRVEPSKGEDRFTATYRFSGEGQQWSRRETLSLSGSTLERRSDPTVDQSGPVESLTYSRCPAR